MGAWGVGGEGGTAMVQGRDEEGLAWAVVSGRERMGQSEVFDWHNHWYLGAGSNSDVSETR